MLQSDKRHMHLTVGILANGGELLGKLVNLSIIWTSSTTKLLRQDTKNEQEPGKGQGGGGVTEGFCSLFFFF